MKEESLNNKVLKLALERGYHSDKLGAIYNKNGKRLKLNISSKKHKYYVFTVRSDSIYGKRNSSKVKAHRLIALEKYGEKIFDDGIEIRHLNGYSLDNSYGNIILGTSEDNHYDIPEARRRSVAKYAASFRRKYTDAEESAIKDFHSKHRSYQLTMDKFGVGKSTLHYILHKVDS